MKGIIISSNRSGGGKTTITLGIMRALRKRGYGVQGYKVGPDYIDTAFHTKITGIPSRNLDIYLMGEEGVKASISRGKGDIGIIEGVMGLYDGIGITSEFSTAHVSRLLNIPIVLVLSPKSAVATLCAEINGLKNYEHINIAGIILNGIKESYFNILKLCIEKNCNIKVLGYIPYEENISIKSRHLGLIQSSEIKDIEEKIELCSILLEKYLDMESFINILKEIENYKDCYHVKNEGITTAVAYDEAFSFYYRENIELLEEYGNVKYFSPLRDRSISENCQAIYIGGGYPEVFSKELSLNKSMLNSIRQKLSDGTVCYAECGGLMYLMQRIQNIDEENTQDEFLDMVGFFKGTVYMTQKLQNFGYSEIEVVKDKGLVKKGSQIKCHEFHKTIIDSNEDKTYKVTKTNYLKEIKDWECGYSKKNTLASYPHVHFFSNMDFLNDIMSKIKRR